MSDDVDADGTPRPDRKTRLVESLTRLVRFRELEAPMQFILQEISLAREHRIALGIGDVDTSAWDAKNIAAATELELLATDPVHVADAHERAKVEDPIYLEFRSCGLIEDLKVMYSLGVATVTGTTKYDFDVEAMAEWMETEAPKFKPVTIDNQVRFVP